MRVTFELDQRQDVSSLLGVDLRLEAKKWREKRSLEANRLLWACLGEIASALKTDDWSVYLMMLERYGVKTYGVFNPKAIDTVKASVRTYIDLGEIEVNGQKGHQLLICFGSSTYDTKQFSRLLDGVISEMEEMGLPTPAQEELDRALEEWEKNQSSKKQSVASSAEPKAS